MRTEQEREGRMLRELCFSPCSGLILSSSSRVFSWCGLIILPSMIPLIFFVFLLQFLQTEGHLGDHHHTDFSHLRSRVEDSRIDHASPSSAMEPGLNVFFNLKNLKVGNKMLIYFPTKDPSNTPHLLSKHESDAIPFSSSKLPFILDLLSFSEGSEQAKAMKETLHHCEFPPLKGESKFCATSLELLLDSLHEIFGSGSKFRVLTTKYLSSISLLQNYTIVETPVVTSAPKIVACHTLPYPYTVFYCHSQESDNKLYKVLLEGEDGGRVEAAAVCHMDTSQWDPNHKAFRVLQTAPGASPVCHFCPANDLIWLPAA